VLLGELLGKTRAAEPPALARRRWLVWALFACLPDVDFLIGWIAFGDWGRLHSGFTHSLVFCVAVALLAAVARKRFALLPGFWTALALVGSHLLLDSASGHLFMGPGYGVMLFYPFSMERVRSPIALFWGPKHHNLAELLGLPNFLGVLWEILVFLPPLLLVLRRKRKAG
jgi:inner membrane protein